MLRKYIVERGRSAHICRENVDRAKQIYISRSHIVTFHGNQLQYTQLSLTQCRCLPRKVPFLLLWSCRNISHKASEMYNSANADLSIYQNPSSMRFLPPHSKFLLRKFSAWVSITVKSTGYPALFECSLK